MAKHRITDPEAWLKEIGCPPYWVDLGLGHVTEADEWYGCPLTSFCFGERAGAVVAIHLVESWPRWAEDRGYRSATWVNWDALLMREGPVEAEVLNLSGRPDVLVLETVGPLDERVLALANMRAGHGLCTLLALRTFPDGLVDEIGVGCGS